VAIQLEHTVVIDRPIEEVFAFATDPEHARFGSLRPWQRSKLPKDR
jgi:hypothetical protein